MTKTEYLRKWRQENPLKVKQFEQNRSHNSRTKELLDIQGGLCAICTMPMIPGKGTCIDHDHTCCPGKRSCGKCIRGLLCQKCNKGLGCFTDDIYKLQTAIEYVQSS
jgi:hypothetical protein